MKSENFNISLKITKVLWKHSAVWSQHCQFYLLMIKIIMHQKHSPSCRSTQDFVFQYKTFSIRKNLKAFHRNSSIQYTVTNANVFGVTFLFDCVTVIHYNTPEAFLTLCWRYTNYYGTWLTILETFSSYFPKSKGWGSFRQNLVFVYRNLANLSAICETSEVGEEGGEGEVGEECIVYCLTLYVLTWLSLPSWRCSGW